MGLCLLIDEPALIYASKMSTPSIPITDFDFLLNVGP